MLLSIKNISCSDQKASLSCVLSDGQDLKYLLLNKDLIEEVYTEEDTIPAPIVQVMDILDKSAYEIDLGNSQNKKFFFSRSISCINAKLCFHSIRRGCP